MRENIYDRSNRCIGFLLEVGTQVQIYNSNSHLLGYYNKNTDTTYKNGSYYGRGNQVMRLLSE
jgi:hypothetical protein